MRDTRRRKPVEADVGDPVTLVPEEQLPTSRRGCATCARADGRCRDWTGGRRALPRDPDGLPGVGIGAGLAGASIPLADAGTISIEAGLAGAFAIGIVAAILLTLVARRLPQAQPSTG
jgi:hypothetical protein